MGAYSQSLTMKKPEVTMKTRTEVREEKSTELNTNEIPFSVLPLQNKMNKPCRKTGRIRGTLCYPCNVRLGWYEKFDARVRAYLRRD
jgi:hypothetical protein